MKNILNSISSIKVVVLNKKIILSLLLVFIYIGSTVDVKAQNSCISSLRFKAAAKSFYMVSGFNTCPYSVKCFVYYGSDSNIIYFDSGETIFDRGCTNSQVCFDFNGSIEYTYRCQRN